ncbi:MAG: ABC transporter ATP-binding protein [Dehalococcoidia bacterium]
MLEVSGLLKQFGGNRAVDRASFVVAQGTITGLIGPNGAGKTTCFNCIAGFLRTDGGTVRFNGEDITGMAPHKIFRRGLVRTFQIPQELGSMTVLENLMLVAEHQAGERVWESWFRPWRVARQERAIAERAKEVLELVELAPLTYEYAGNLSGGQRKLLELARALMAQPKMVLLDEPGAGINPTLARRLTEHIRTVQQTQGLTFLLIEHDMDLVARLCDPVIVMTNGSVLMEGPPAAILADAGVQEAYLGSQYR